MLILLWFWYSFVALCSFCVRFGPLYVASAADFAEMLKTYRFLMVLLKIVGFVVEINCQEIGMKYQKIASILKRIEDKDYN